MTIGDGSLAHPVELARDLAELVRVVDRLAVVQEQQLERDARTKALGRGLWENGVLFAGAANLAGAQTWQKSFSTAFASVVVSDPNELGPLLVTNGQGHDESGQIGGVGTWVVPRGGREVIPFGGTEVDVQALALPSYRQVLAPPRYAQAAVDNTSATLAAAPATGQLRVRSAWASQGSSGIGVIQSSDASVLVLGLPDANTAIAQVFDVDGPLAPAGTSLEVVAGTNGFVDCGIIYDVVATSGPALCYVAVLLGRP